MNSAQILIVAECMRQARLGHCGGVWDRQTDDTKEEWCQSALALTLLLRERGIQVVENGAPIAAGPSPSGHLFATDVVGQPGTIRAVRPDKGGFAIVTVKDGQETVEQTFTLKDAALFEGQAMSGAPEAAKRQGGGRMLAAAFGILTMHAASLEGCHEG